MMQDYRRVALCLHGLAEADRQWLLGKLAEADRAALRPLLDELVELGLPRDSVELTWGDAAADRSGSVPAHITPLDAASVDAVWRVLQREQPATIALIMEYYPWQWSGAVTKRWGANRQHAVMAARGRRRNAVSQRVRDSVIAAFARAVADELRLAPVRKTGLARLAVLAWFR